MGEEIRSRQVSRDRQSLLTGWRQLSHWNEKYEVSELEVSELEAVHIDVKVIRNGNAVRCGHRGEYRVRCVCERLFLSSVSGE